jgi:Protein of unknown function (DUF3500)
LQRVAEAFNGRTPTHAAMALLLAGLSEKGSSPQFFGANPAEVRDGPMKGTRVLRAEEDLGRSPATSLSAAPHRVR